MTWLRPAVLLCLVALAPMAWAAEPGTPPPNGDLKSLPLPEWQSGWFEALHSGNCPEAERLLADGRQGNAAAADTMEAVMTRDGLCRPADPDRAEALFQRAIRQRYIPAMWGLAWGYLGHGLPADETKARWWYQAAILRWFTDPKVGHADKELVETLFYFSLDTAPPDWWNGEEFLRFMEMSIRSEAMADYADRIEAGNGFLPDPQAACLWRIEAVEFGSSEAAVALGDQLLQGRGVPARPDRAAYWWNRRAHPPAMARLGALLIDGAEGVPADPRAALILLAHAKRRGEAVDDQLRQAATSAGRQPVITSALLKEKEFLTDPPWNRPDEMDCWE
ncbi:tetratricopeptide repeat protein [Magnetospirillum sp. UT-4]|uniref:tetratricopeptide repeat protein n=1 Tax=Magnetospirillum sp. UT-4 TaxID=2681467 RepID=UPI0013814A73|nr:SEL1-like repeat protein [Magnetospirillum sp. UT-4]CAA7621602.1 exported hypothetical protein [Magnetospirillum sp. UT-4]